MFKLYLSEYAKAKQIMANELQTKVDVIVEHLIKLILMPNNEAYKHWQSEIAGHLHTIHKLKGKNKYPTFDQLYDWTYNKIYEYNKSCYFRSCVISLPQWGKVARGA